MRERYPPTPRSNRGLGTGRRRFPCEPTDAIPGTPEKIRVLMDRAARGQELFHDDDALLIVPVLELAG